jgi:hypothetical protein
MAVAVTMNFLVSFILGEAVVLLKLTGSQTLLATCRPTSPVPASPL